MVYMREVLHKNVRNSDRERMNKLAWVIDEEWKIWPVYKRLEDYYKILQILWIYNLQKKKTSLNSNLLLWRLSSKASTHIFLLTQQTSPVLFDSFTSPHPYQLFTNASDLLIVRYRYCRRHSSDWNTASKFSHPPLNSPACLVQHSKSRRVLTIFSAIKKYKLISTARMYVCVCVFRSRV